MGVSSVHLDRLTNVQVSSVLGLVERFYMIVTDEVLPDEARRLFLSGLSNIAISLCPSPCVVTYHGTEALLCRLSMPLKDGPECAPLLDEFGVILPDMKDLPWLALIHNTQTLILTLHLPLLVAEVCHHKKPSVYLRGTIRSFRSELPMRRHEFWEIVDAARDTPSSIVCSSQLIALDCCGFVTQLMESVKFWHITQPRGTQDEGSGDFEAARDAFAPGAAVTTRLEFGSFTLRSTTFPHPSLLEGMAAVHRLFELFSPRHVFTSECIRDEEVDMDAAGSVFFDCPGRVVSVENCTFISTRVGGQIIICKDTYVYFKNTLFSHALLGAIVGEDESAFFVCVDCKEIEAFEESNSQNASLGECPAQKEVYSEKQKLIVVSIHRVKCELELTTGRQLAFELPLGEMRIAIESNEIKFSAHLQHGLCAFFNGDESCPVILDTETHAEAVLIGKNEEVVVAVTFQVGGVVIPFHLVQALHDVVLRWNYVPSVTGTNPFLSYGTHRSVKSLFKWEVFLAVSTLPVTLCLPGGVTFAKMTLISSVFRSKGDSEESARVEVRVGVEELFMWEFTMHAFAPVIKQPLTVAVTAQSTGFVNFSCEVNISAVDLCVSTEQIHSTLSLLSGLRAGSTTATKTHSSRLVNLLGLPVCLDHTMEDGQEQRVLVDSQPASWQATLVSPQNVSTAGEWKVRDLCRVVQGIGEPPNTDLFTTVDMATLSNGEKIQITSCVSRYTLSQHVTLRTVFHIVNQLPCYAVLSSNMAGAAMVVACPGETSCIPLSLFDCRNILLSLVREDGTNESNKEPLCKEESPREILKMAETRGDDSIGRLKLFEFSGDKAYVDVTYRLQGSFLTMFLAPAWPSIRNGIRFALKVRLLRNGMCVEEALVNPNDVFVTLRHDPHGPRVEYFFECAVYSQLYISSYPVDVRFIDPVAGESVVMKHKEFPCRYFFELSIEQHIHDVPSDSPAYVIKPRHVFGLENNSHTDVRITSEAGDSVGSLGGGVLACEPGRNFAYLPFHTPLTVHALSASPHVFKVGKSLEDRILQSALVDVAEDATVMHCLLLRSRNQGVDRFMELLPPLVVVNLNTRCDVVVSHSVKGKVSAKDEWCRRFTVPAGRALPCTILSSDEYTDYLAFAWTGNQGDEAGGVERDGNGAISIDVGSVSTALCDTNYFDRRNDDTNKKTRTVACPETCFSVPLEVLLLPKTNWSGFVQCGSTHHVVCIRKEGLYDTAIVTISAPRTPYVTLVNLTPNAYGALPPMTVLGITPPSVNSDELTLMNATNDEKESKLRISIDWDSDVDIGNGVTAALRCHRDGATVVFTQRELNSMCSLQSGKWTSRNSPQGSGHMKDSPGKNDTVVRLDVKFSRFSLFVRDVADTPLHLAFDSCSLWAVYQKMKITTQCTVSNIQSKGTYQGNKSHEVKPFCLDMTVRDIRFKGKTLSALSTHVNVSPLDMELSDVFAYQIQQLGKLFRTSLPAMDSGSTDVASMMAEVAQMNANPLGGLKLHLGLLLLFDIRAVLSYDRSVSPPEDVLFSGSPIGGIIPSIHQATVSLPKLQFHNLSGNSVVEVWSILSEKLASEFLKQVPQMLSSVVLFPSIFPVRRTLARIGSFIFGTETSDPEVQDTLLI
ncbi:hypothetical protein ERJ75_000757300 [Trypanosoma vivax]|nr:hypothetical protein ERJ75_000757300 [Trypanosoma vivax]